MGGRFRRSDWVVGRGPHPVAPMAAPKAAPKAAPEAAPGSPEAPATAEVPTPAEPAVPASPDAEFIDMLTAPASDEESCITQITPADDSECDIDKPASDATDLGFKYDCGRSAACVGPCKANQLVTISCISCISCICFNMKSVL